MNSKYLLDLTTVVWSSEMYKELKNVTPDVPLSDREHISIDWKEAMVIPAIMFGLGVVGNSLGITFLLMHRYRRVRPRSPITYSTTGFASSPKLSRSRNSSVAEAACAQQRRRSSARYRTKRDASVSPHSGGTKNKFGPFYTLVLGLITLDLIGNLATSPLTMLLYSTNRTIKATGGDSLCMYSAFAMMYFGFVTMATLMTMAIERVLSIQFPYYYHKHVTPKKAAFALFMIFAGSAVFAALPKMGFGKVRSMFPHTWCFADWYAIEAKDKAFNFIYAISGILMIFTTVICNVAVVVGLFKMKQKLKSRGTRKRRSLRRETQMIIQLIVMTSIYIVCWLPLMIRIMANQITFERSGDKDRIAIWLAAANPILDPWVYILLRWSVVKRVVKLAKSLCIHDGNQDKVILTTGKVSPEMVKSVHDIMRQGKKAKGCYNLIPLKDRGQSPPQLIITPNTPPAPSHHIAPCDVMTASLESIYDNLNVPDDMD